MTRAPRGFKTSRPRRPPVRGIRAVLTRSIKGRLMALLTPGRLQVLLALSVATTLAGCSEAAKGAEGGARGRTAKASETEPVKRESINRNVNVSGTLAAENDVTVSSQAEGVV